jgi:hypothetical protein
MIPVPGRGSVPVGFTFRILGAAEGAQFAAKVHQLSDLERVMQTTVAWELEEPFTAENVATFLSNYPAAADAIGYVYTSRLLSIQDQLEALAQKNGAGLN